MDTPETLTITKDQLDAAFLRWTEEHRAGACLSNEELAAMSLEEAAMARSDHFWLMLNLSERKHG